jgi:hypothetical protein
MSRPRIALRSPASPAGIPTKSCRNNSELYIEKKFEDIFKNACAFMFSGFVSIFLAHFLQ